MIIISHRGYWNDSNDKNKLVAFERSFSKGFGTETDIRDFNGRLVISHDIPTPESISFDEFLKTYCRYRPESNPPLALNVKADGLQSEVKKYLTQYNIDNYFFFDMSIPDMLGYLKEKLTTFARISEYERENSLFEYVQGVWLDGFAESIVDEKMIQDFIKRGKRVCMVSPELHRRPHLPVWEQYKSFQKELLKSDQLILCTDIPEEAQEFFNEH